MRKLSKIIDELTEEDFLALEQSLRKNNAEKFLLLLQMYRRNFPRDKMGERLEVSSGALYALRSRLYDRIQAHFSGNIFSGSEQVLAKLHEIPGICHGRPRSISIAFLLKLEEDLKRFDMHNELVIVYSALKKMNLFTGEYFHYSQLYNKHIAFNLSVEKSEEILGSFNRLLRQYDFSRIADHYDTLMFLQQEIAQHYTLHQSRQIEIIKHIIDVQMALFCHTTVTTTSHIPDLLNRCDELLEELPELSPLKPWKPCIDFLYFEYFLRQEQYTKAEKHYKQFLPSRAGLMLSVHVAVTSFLPVSEQILFQNHPPAEDPREEDYPDLRYDPADLHAVIMTQVASSLDLYRQRKLKEAAGGLNDILNAHSLKDAFHLSLEIRLMLLFIYLRLRNYDMAETLLRNLARKTKSDHKEYTNAVHLFNLFNAEIRKKGKLGSADSEQFLLFEARNQGRIQLLRPLLRELKNIYAQ